MGYCLTVSIFAVKLQVPKFFGISAQIIPKLCNKLILDNAKIFETFNSLTEFKILIIFDDFNDKVNFLS